MSTTINGSSTSTLATALFDKLDTKKKGYIEQADLQAASGTDSDDSTTAEVFKAIDGDSDGKITKSELSVALQKVGDELNAQRDQSRVAAAGGDAAATDGSGTDVAGSAEAAGNAAAASGAAAGAKGAPPGGAGGPPPGGGGGSAGAAGSTGSTDASASTVKYVAAADTDNDGTVTDAEQAAYDKAQAASQLKAAEEKAAALKAQTQVAEYTAVSTSGDAVASSAAVDVSA